MSYRKYDPMVMKMIIETGNRNLFPELNIPRTTINYWLKTSKSFELTPEFAGDIITDSGTENTAKEIQKIIWGRGVRHLIAKKDIHFSNSMVEAVFRQLKQKFLIQESSTFSGLYQKLYKFTHQYNKVIPHSSLEGATPVELYDGSFERNKFKKELRERLFEQRKIRREKYLKLLDY